MDLRSSTSVSPPFGATGAYFRPPSPEWDPRHRRIPANAFPTGFRRTAMRCVSSSAHASWTIVTSRQPDVSACL